MTGQKSHTLAASRRGSPLGLLLAMLALAIQCLVIQPHIDASYAPVSVATAHVSVHASQPSRDTQGVCVICQAMATTGAFALSTSPTLVLIERHFINTLTVHRSEPSQRTRSHNWQSRAPPQAI